MLARQATTWFCRLVGLVAQSKAPKHYLKFTLQACQSNYL